MSESLQRQNNRSRERLLFNKIPVMIKDFPSTETVDIDAALRTLEDRIPQWCFSNVDIVYIGIFDIFIELLLCSNSEINWKIVFFGKIIDAI